MYGYTGKVLRVDLARGTCTGEPLEEETALVSIGGRGLNSVRLLEETEGGRSPLEPSAPVYFGVGPLTGTGLPASSRFTVTAKSPLTGIFGATNAGGHWAAELKFAGFDQIVVTGRAPTPVVLWIEDGMARILEAPELEGRTVRETTTDVKRMLGAPDAHVLAIGPAGEREVPFACLAANLTRVGGRTGMGAVLGSKNLKAVALRGRGRVSVADPAGFRELAARLEESILSHEGYGRRRALGTTALMTDLDDLGILPTRHFQKGVCDFVKNVSGEYLAAHFNVKDKSCFMCNVHCSRYYDAGSIRGEGPEYETLCTFTTKLGIDDARFALAMNNLVNELGLDSISTGETIAWAVECAEKGLLDPEVTGGLDLAWGNRDTVEALIRQIARREGLGALLSKGVRAASAEIGNGTEELAFHVKGLEMICGDPRGLKAYGLTYAIASRGADHLHAEPFFEMSGDTEGAKRRFGHEDAARRMAWRGKGALVHWSERLALLTDCLTMCKNVGLCMDVLDLPGTVEILRAGTGLGWTEEGLWSALSGILEAERAFNRREGVTGKDDVLPLRFTSEPLEEGPSKGSVVELDHMLREYRNLDSSTE